MRIAIYGGSYNPIHTGHTSLAQSLIDQELADEVWLLVSPLNPLKQKDTSQFAPYEHRFRMAEIAVSHMQSVKASDFENHLPIPSYMIHTLDALQNSYPEDTFILVIGADNWERFSHWYKSDEILHRFSLLIYNRPGYQIKEESIKGKKIQIVNTPLYDISSTQLREALKQDKDTGNWLPEGVKEYIAEHKLYE